MSEQLVSELKQILGVSIEASTPQTTELGGTWVGDPEGQGLFDITYNTPPGNRPEEASVPQFLTIWEVADPSSIYVAEPIKSIPIDGTSRSGNETLDDFDRKKDAHYVFGYCYGKFALDKQMPVGATLDFAPGENEGVPFSPTLTLPTPLGGSAVVSSYKTPVGNDPYKNRNWWGIARGSSITNGPTPQRWEDGGLVEANDNQNVPNGSALVSTRLSVQTPYVFAYGYSPDPGSGSVGMYHSFFVTSEKK